MGDCLLHMTYAFRATGGISRARVREPADPLLVRWRIASEKDCRQNLAASQNLREKQIQLAEKRKNCGAVALLSCNAELPE